MALTSPRPNALAMYNAQPAEDRAVRPQLLVRPRGDHGAGALVGKLAGQSQARPHGGRGRHRLPAADRALEGLWRRHRLPGRDARNADLGLGPARLDQAHHRVRHRACAAVQPGDRRQGDRDRRPHRRAAASASTSSSAGTRASSRCSASSSASTRRATSSRRNGSTSIKTIWSPKEDFDFEGQYLKLKGIRGKPKPVGGARPLIMNAGASATGRAFAVKNCDAFFLQASRVSTEETAGFVQEGEGPRAASTAARSASTRSAWSPAGARRRKPRSTTITRSSRTPTSPRSTASWR